MFGMHPQDVIPYFEKSRKDLGLDYVDLYLIHQPMGIEGDGRDWIKISNGKVCFYWSVYQEF